MMTHNNNKIIEANLLLNKENTERKDSIQKMITCIPYPRPAYDMVKASNTVYYEEHNPIAWKNKRWNPLQRDLRKYNTLEFLTNLTVSKNVVLLDSLAEYGLIESRDVLMFS